MFINGGEGNYIVLTSGCMLRFKEMLRWALHVFIFLICMFYMGFECSNTRSF